MNNTTHHKLYISSLSPIHIGVGQDLSPTDYVIDQQKCYFFDPLTMIQTLSVEQKRELNSLCNTNHKNSFIQLQRFFYHNKSTIKTAATHIVPILKSIEQYYLSKLDFKITDNDKANLAIAQTLQSPFTQSPLIAGSTIKGTLRTAITNKLIHSQNINQDRHNHKNNKSKEIEKRLLHYNKANEDPFSALKVSDFSSQTTAQILFACQIKKEQPNEIKNKLTLQCIAAGEIRAFSGQISINSQAINNRNLSEAMTLKAQFNALNQLYLPQLEQELARMEYHNQHQGYFLQANFNWLQQMQQLLHEIKPALAQGQAALIRLGKYAGAESKTWDGKREIKISAPGKKPYKYANSATTTWLASNNRNNINQALPLGWALIEQQSQLLNTNTLNNFAALGKRWQQELKICQQQLQQLTEQQKVLKEQQRQQAQQQAQQALIETQKAKEQAQRKASLSPAELALEELREALDNQRSIEEVREQLKTAVKEVLLSQQSELKETAKAFINEIAQVWGTKRNKNKTLKKLWGDLNA